MTMKAKRIIALLVLACILVGCGAATEDSMSIGSSNGAPGMDRDPGIYEEMGSASATGGVPQLEGQKLITTVEVSAETEDLDELMAAVNNRIAELGGYIEFQNTYFGSAYANYRYRSANMTIRIPAENLADFLQHMEGISNVVSKQQSQENVTLQYVDTESRMAALQAERDRLMELMEQAGDLSDLLQIEARLTEVLYELESTTAQLRSLDNQVSYATVELFIDEVTEYTPVQERTVWQRIAAGFTENIRDIGEGVQDFFVWLVTYSPQLILIAAAAFLITRIIRRAIRRRKAKKEEA